MDDSLLEQQRAAYAVQGVDESEPVQAAKKKKRKKDAYTNGEEVCHTQSTPTLPSPDLSIPCWTHWRKSTQGSYQVELMADPCTTLLENRK